MLDFKEIKMSRRFLEESVNRGRLMGAPSIFGVPLQVVHPANGIDLQAVADSIHRILSHFRFLFKSLDAIYIGSFPALEDRGLNAMFYESALWLTNEQSSVYDMVEDIVHEMAHVLEEQFKEEVYGDGLIEKEYIAKKTAVLDSLMEEEDMLVDTMLEDLEYDALADEEIAAIFQQAKNETEFDPVFDELLYSQFDFDQLRNHCLGHFTTPYAAVSLSEYFAIGFEWFQMKDRRELRETCPLLYMKLEEIEEKIH
jgi:hypothetical protein